MGRIEAAPWPLLGSEIERATRGRMVACCSAVKVFVTRKLPGDALDRLAGAHEVEVWPEPGPPPPD